MLIIYRSICEFILCYCKSKLVKKPFLFDNVLDVFQDGGKHQLVQKSQIYATNVLDVL